jgi:hypothetical protein
VQLRLNPDVVGSYVGGQEPKRESFEPPKISDACESNQDRKSAPPVSSEILVPPICSSRQYEIINSISKVSMTGVREI